MSSYEWMIGLRYTRAKARNHFISFISAISMLGIALGITALIVVLSVMNGFQTELRSRILAVVSHIQMSGHAGSFGNIVSANTGKLGERSWEEAAEEAKRHPEVIGAAPYVQEQGMISVGQAVRGAIIRGVLPELENKVADIGHHMKEGSLVSLKPDEFGIVLGSELARTLQVLPGEKVTVIAPQGVVTPAGVLPRLKTFTVTGIFEVGMFEYDSGLALIHMNDAQKLYRMHDTVSGVRLKLKDLFLAPQVTRQLAASLSFPAYLSDWTKSHANFFRAVQIEKNMMFIILSLIVAVAAFNIVSTLVMAVTDKQADIAILRTLGANPSSIMKIFMVQGTLIGLVGLLLGVVGGVTIALNVDVIVPMIEQVLGTQILSKEVYYISSLPSELQLKDVILISLISFSLTLMATIYPSYRASRTHPAEALRYE